MMARNHKDGRSPTASTATATTRIAYRHSLAMPGWIAQAYHSPWMLQCLFRGHAVLGVYGEQSANKVVGGIRNVEFDLGKEMAGGFYVLQYLLWVCRFEIKLSVLILWKVTEPKVVGDKNIDPDAEGPHIHWHPAALHTLQCAPEMKSQYLGRHEWHGEIVFPGLDANVANPKIGNLYRPLVLRHICRFDVTVNDVAVVM